MKTNNLGFSLIELSISMAIGTILFFSGSNLITMLFQANQEYINTTMAQTSLKATSDMLRLEITNTIGLTPADDASRTNDRYNYGMYPFASNSFPSQCLIETDARGLRYNGFINTQVTPGVPSVTLLKSWNETSAGFSLDVNRLRLTIPAGSTNPYLGTERVKEIWLVDTDGLTKRRYEIEDAKLVSTNLDPQDDLPKNDELGIPIQFNYMSLALQLPRRIDGVRTVQRNLSFGKKAMAIAAETRIICVDPSTKNVVSINRISGSKRVVMLARSDGFELETFIVSYRSSVDVAEFLNVFPFYSLPFVTELETYIEFINPKVYAEKAIRSGHVLKVRTDTDWGSTRTSFYYDMGEASQNYGPPKSIPSNGYFFRLKKFTAPNIIRSIPSSGVPVS